MRSLMRCGLAMLLALLVLVGGTSAVYARAGHGRGAASGGHFSGHGGFRGHGGGDHFRGGHFRGGHFRGGHVFLGVGPSFYWGPGYWGPGYWDPYWGYGSPSVVVEQPPAVYAERSYWYYCQSAGAYYPYVGQCPEGWLRVLPQ